MINKYCNNCVEYLKERVSFCFEKGDPTSWTTVTWSKKVQRSYIEMHGKQLDQEHLTEATRRNKEKGFKRRNRGREEGSAYVPAATKEEDGEGK
jgi:hypothetical protein